MTEYFYLTYRWNTRKYYNSVDQGVTIMKEFYKKKIKKQLL